MEKKDNRPFDLTVNFPYDGSVRYENGSISCKVKYDDGSGDEIFGVEGVSSAFITYDDTLVINLSDGNRRMKNVAELMDFITNDIEFGDYAHNIRTYGRAYEEMSWHQCAALFLLSPNTNGEEKI